MEIIAIRVFAIVQALSAYAGEPLVEPAVSNTSSLLQMIARDKARVLMQTCALDVVMVIDTSGSICNNVQASCEDWGHQTSSAALFAEQLKKRTGSRLGFLTFSTHANVQAKLGTEFDSIASKLRSMDYVTVDPAWPRWTNIKEGLELAGRELRNKQKADNRRIVLTFTDGEPTAGGGPELGNGPEHKDAAIKAAKDVKIDSQLTMVAIGQANTAFMRSLVSKPESENFFPISSFDQLTQGSFIDDLIEGICNSATPAPPRATPAPAPGPRPSCQKDTRADCSSMGGLCFQRTRGHTSCETSKIDGRKTCHCQEKDECVYQRDMPFTRGGQWGVCRKNADEMRGESNPVSWFLVVALDIVSSYAKMLR